jgi:rhodanese-related sulfurtransferase
MIFAVSNISKLRRKTLMKILMTAIALFLMTSTAALAQAPAPAKPPVTAASHANDKFAFTSAHELSEMFNSGKPVHVLDVNSAANRRAAGTIEGARLMSSYNNYDPSELPVNKTEPVVIYCADANCKEAPIAARRAADMSYEKVSILHGGLASWMKFFKTVKSAK